MRFVRCGLAVLAVLSVIPIQRAEAGTADGLFDEIGPMWGGGTFDVVVAGRGGVPASGVGSVALNVTAVLPSTPGYLTVWPTGQPQPNASNVNFVPGQVVPNMVIVPLGTNGQISMWTPSGAVDVLVDVLGWFPIGDSFNGLNPARLMDTRRQATTAAVQLLILDPVLHNHGSPGQRLYDYFGWTAPNDQNSQTMDALSNVSHGSLNYFVNEVVILDEWPVLADGYAYTEDTWFQCYVVDRSSCHGLGDTIGHPEARVDYLRILNNNQSCEKFNRGTIDEVWIWGMPFQGTWESTLAGTGAWSMNGYPVAGSTCTAPLPIMGYNYERTIAESLHSYGHRIESTLIRVFGYGYYSPARLFLAYNGERSDIVAGCGNVHFPPNGVQDYDYLNPTVVQSTCAEWSAWPTQPTNAVPVSCATWGCTQEGYLMWWASHIPAAPGTTDGLDNNWWHYIISPRSTIQRFV